MTYAPAPRRNRDSAAGGLKLVGGMTVLMWVLEFVDTPLGGLLDRLGGIHPRDLASLVDIVTAPFLHAGFGHLMGNTVPFVVLGAMIAASGALRVLAVTATVILVSGLGVWLFAPPMSFTVGASGLVFGFAAYLVARGVFTRQLGQLAVGLLVVVVWGGMLLGGLLPQPGISWQAHLFGAVGGVVGAAVFRGRSRRDVAGVPSTRWS